MSFQAIQALTGTSERRIRALAQHSLHNCFATQLNTMLSANTPNNLGSHVAIETNNTITKQRRQQVITNLRAWINL